MNRNTFPDSRHHFSLGHVGDLALLEDLAKLIGKTHRIEAQLLVHLGEVDHRRLFAKQAYPSMFQYCVDELHLSEASACKRITVARAARAFPLLLDKIAKGELHLSGACLLIPHLTDANVQDLLAKATHKSKRAIGLLLAAEFPQADVPTMIRKLPTKHANNEKEHTQTGLPATSQPKPDVLPRAIPEEPQQKPVTSRHETKPLSVSRYKIQFTMSAKTYDQLQEAQALLGPRVSKDDLDTLFGKALDLLVSDLKNKKHGVTDRPQKNKKPAKATAEKSRTIPRAIRREVYERDAGQCTYKDGQGRRCAGRYGLEYHHRCPHGRGGQATVDNIELRCRVHNLLAGEEDYGKTKMNTFRVNCVREARSSYGVGVFGHHQLAPANTRWRDPLCFNSMWGPRSFWATRGSSP